MYAESQSHEITRIQADCPRCKALEADIGKKIAEAVGSYRCQYTIGEDDGGDDVALVDVLTPPGESSIKLGRQECELLVDHIYNSLVPAALAEGRITEREHTCEWTEDADGAWETECGGIWEFVEGGPGENGVRHCVYCGAVIVPVAYNTEAERKDGDDPNDVIRRHLARGGFGDQLDRHPLEQVVGMAINALEAERGAAVVPSRSLLRYQLDHALKKVEMLADRSHAQEKQLAEAQAFLSVERGEREDLAELLEQLTLAVGAPNFAEAVRLAIAGTGVGSD